MRHSTWYWRIWWRIAYHGPYQVNWWWKRFRIGREGSTDRFILLTDPIYLSMRTPLIGNRRWHLRFRFWRWHLELRLNRAAKCKCGAIITKPWELNCSNGHSGENIWWHQVA